MMVALVRNPISAFKQPAKLAPILAGILALAAYASNVATDLTWSNYGGDGGELITAAVTLGVPHPPGYPLYVILGKLFATGLPFGTVAFRLNLLSAVLMSVASGFLTATLLNLVPPNKNSPLHKSTLPYLAGGLSFALAPLVWGLASVAEVYPLNLALLAALLWMLATGRASRRTILAGALLGAAVTAHLTAMLALPMTAGLVPRRRWPSLAVGLLIGLSPFLVLLLLSRSQSPVSWGEARSLDGWWWLVSARLYQPNILSLPESQWASRLAQWVPQLVQQYTVVGFPLALLGIGACWSRSNQFSVLTVATWILFVVYAYFYRTSDAFVYLLPAVLLLGLLIGCALIRVGWLAVLLPLALLGLNLSMKDTHTAASIREATYELLGDADRDAVVITEGEPTIFALWYFQHVEGMRPDIILVDADLFQFDWYRQQLASGHPDLRGLERDDLGKFAALNVTLRPVCQTSLVRPISNICSGS